MEYFDLKHTLNLLYLFSLPLITTGLLFLRKEAPHSYSIEEGPGDACDTTTFQMTYEGKGDNQILDIISIPGDEAISVGRISTTAGGNYYNAWILKTGKTGSILWSKIYGGSGTNFFKRVISTDDGGLLAGGITHGPTSPQGNALAVKTDADGNVQWSFELKIPYTYIQAMWQTTDGGFALLATVDQIGSTARIIVIKVDQNGQSQWTKQYYSSISDYGDCLMQTSDGNLVITGFTHSFGLSSHDCQIMKVSIKDGELIWLKTFGSPSDDVVDWVVEDTDGDLYLSTQWGNTAALFKTNQNGDILWGKSYTWNGHNGRGYNLRYTSNQNLIWGVSDENNSGAILNVAADGTIIWAHSYQVTGASVNMEYPVDELASHTGYYIGGYTNPGNGATDGYLIKTDLQGNTKGCTINKPSFQVSDIHTTETKRTWTVEPVTGWQPVTLKTAALETKRNVICPQCCVSSNTTIDTAVCEGTNYTLPNDSVVKDAGAYTVKFTSASGCDSIITTNLTFNPAYSQTVYDTIQQPEQYTLPDGQMADTTGTYVANLQTVTGCDSVITTHLFVKPRYSITIYDTTCEHTPYMLPDGENADTAGVYVTTLKTIQDDDSVITTHLFIHPVYQTTVYDTICRNEIYTLPDGNTVDTIGTYTSNLSAITGCDSIVTTHLAFRDYILNEIPRSLCTGDSILLPDGTVVRQAGIYPVLLHSVTSCDTLAVYQVTGKTLPDIHLPEDTCLIAGQTLALTPQKGYPQYQWSTGSNADSLNVSFPGLYWVKASNECGISADSITISNNCLPVIFIPNAFTPNGDGMNDVFRILNVHGQKLIRFDIYSRWGEQVFHSTDIRRGWNGRYNNHEAAIGAYVYMINLIDLDNHPKMYKGTVLLLR